MAQLSTVCSTTFLSSIVYSKILLDRKKDLAIINLTNEHFDVNEKMD